MNRLLAGGVPPRGCKMIGSSHILGGMEYFFACPYCSERISMVLDTSVKGQTYMEDCEVCCHPIEVRYTVEDDEVCRFEARAVE
jgi:hypothetical protein